MRTMFVCFRASTLPTVIVSAASTKMNGCHTFSACGNVRYTMLTRATKPPALDADRQERGDRRRRALVRVGGPGVERHRAHLEAEADDDEHDRQGVQAAELAVGGDVGGDVGEQRRVGDAVQQAHPVEHDRAGEHAEQEVLHARLVALRVALAPRGQHVGGDGQELQGDEHADEIAAPRSSSPCRARCSTTARSTRPGSSRPLRSRWSTAARRRTRSTRNIAFMIRLNSSITYRPPNIAAGVVADQRQA